MTAPSIPIGTGDRHRTGVGNAAFRAGATYRILLPFDSDVHKCLRQFKQLEEEEPQLHVLWDEELGEIQVQLMGDVQIGDIKAHDGRKIWSVSGLLIQEILYTKRQS